MRGGRPSRFGGELSVVDEFVENLDVVPEHGVVREDHLEAVELRRIVRARYLNAAVDGQRLGRKVERGGGQLADVEGGATGGRDPLTDSLCEPGA